MNFKEKILYNQIHPLKLATDISASVISLYFFWQHALVFGLIVHIIPPIVVSFLVIKYANLEKQKESELGKYISKYMGGMPQAIRLGGDVVTVFGAWYQNPYIIGSGLVIVILAWINGLSKK